MNLVICDVSAWTTMLVHNSYDYMEIFSVLLIIVTSSNASINDLNN